MGLSNPASSHDEHTPEMTFVSSDELQQPIQIIMQASKILAQHAKSKEDAHLVAQIQETVETMASAIGVEQGATQNTTTASAAEDATIDATVAEPKPFIPKPFDE